ncbi:PhzF family phenazine biosynthesis isomerase [Brevibacillus laterosporus]|uniref:PhzF family phenazine biosynthesis isomerase n=1 Tax=Brevibacillus laterosporus TaxID=1465 RepID=UPI002652AB55|nr:PhzF family phenazine biosynthesis isomerase [Brevibacillus laterosporus]MDN9011139.1 PhzF family phenazine biosynthesis isomerase [Brevibacillus laterosporus]MDO0942162.1 PhzF family phenazine biosynthesis isomerase [Brevibacillus laterosporus]
MNTIQVYHYDAFSTQPDKGNPAGVVFTGNELTEKEMQEVAQKVGFNETAFVLASDVADLRIRYFTPGHENNLCGHATIAAIYALKTTGQLGDKNHLTIETKAGILPIKMEMGTDDKRYITMKQAAPQFEDFTGSQEELADSIGLTIDDIETDLPITYGSTGIWTLLVPIKKLSAFQKMKPDNARFPSVLQEMPKASVHPFCLETYDSQAQMHGRHFSSPFSGTREDPVTGTASGVMGAYYAQYISDDFDTKLRLVIEQGQEIQKDGRVEVTISKNHESYDVEITGTAVYVKAFEISI